LVVLAVVLVLAGCASSRRAETVRVPVEGNAWIGSIIPRLQRAGLRIAIPETWGASSFGTPMALLARAVRHRRDAADDHARRPRPETSTRATA
jgi:hypothetical protein